ncbi:hypothetical protein D3C81_1451380 [compost metagenome]
MRWGIGTAVGIAALIPGAVVSSWMLRPIRRLLMKLRPVEQDSILGKAGQVTSPDVTAERGYAQVDDGGAGLILQVRSRDGRRYVRGDQVRLVDYLREHNHYLVVGDTELPALDVSIPQVSGDKEIH